MPDRETLLGRLAVGDIFHAESPEGHSMVCLATAVTETTIKARTVTHQVHLAFDRRTGVARWHERDVVCTINSVAPLPIEIHNVFLGLDRKMRLEQDPERFKLSRAEIDAISFVDKYYPENPV